VHSNTCNVTRLAHQSHDTYYCALSNESHITINGVAFVPSGMCDVIYLAAHSNVWYLVWNFQLKMQHPRKSPNLETQIPRYEFESNQKSGSLYREIPRNLSFSIWRVSGMQHFQWKLWYVSTWHITMHCRMHHITRTLWHSSMCEAIYLSGYIWVVHSDMCGVTHAVHSTMCGVTHSTVHIWRVWRDFCGSALLIDACVMTPDTAGHCTFISVMILV